MMNSSWLICPVCGGKTRDQIRSQSSSQSTTVLQTIILIEYRKLLKPRKALIFRGFVVAKRVIKYVLLFTPFTVTQPKFIPDCLRQWNFGLYVSGFWHIMPKHLAGQWCANSNIITLGKKQDIVYNGMGNSKTIKIWEEF